MSPDRGIPSRRARARPAALAAGLLVLAGGLLAVASAGPTAAGEPRLLLSWNAPFGLPGAAESITVPCGDTTRADTLYLCMDPGKDSPTFLGFSAEVLFRVPPPDTLPRFWHFDSLAARRGHPRMLLQPDSSCGVPSPFRIQGIGQFRADCSRERARVRMIFAVALALGTPVKADTTYLLARVVMPRPPAGDPACGRALCVEWTQADLGYGLGDLVTTSRGLRFAGLNAPERRACALFHAAPGVKLWRPPGAKNTR